MRTAEKGRDIKSAILRAALPHVPFDGWTDAVLALAAKEAGVPAAKLDKAFPGGGRDLVGFFFLWADKEMLKKMTAQPLHKMRVRDKIAAGVRARIEILSPYKLAFVKALAASRSGAPRRVWTTADKIWWAAGDTATDYNHYTKRLLLSSVITATTLYWLADESRDNAATFAFLERRIDDVLKIGQKISRFKKPAAGAA
jgi:ubiquinone biosynthesis protein COQ9